MNEYGRWAKRRVASHFGPVQKCSLCKTAWLYGKDRRIMGVCIRCERMALRRKEIIDAAHESLATERVKWVDGWPGTLEIEFAGQSGQVPRRYSYEEIAGAFDVKTFLAVERHRLLRQNDE